MAAGWLHKVRTGSGSDRVVSEMLDSAGHYKNFGLTGKIVHAFRPGRYRSRF